MSSRRTARAQHQTRYATTSNGDAQLAALRLGALAPFWRDGEAIADLFPALPPNLVSPLRIRGAWHRAANDWAARHRLTSEDGGTDWHALRSILDPKTR